MWLFTLHLINYWSTFSPCFTEKTFSSSPSLPLFKHTLSCLQTHTDRHSQTHTHTHWGPTQLACVLFHHLSRVCARANTHTHLHTYTLHTHKTKLGSCRTIADQPYPPLLPDSLYGPRFQKCLTHVHTHSHWIRRGRGCASHTNQPTDKNTHITINKPQTLSPP